MRISDWSSDVCSSDLLSTAYNAKLLLDSGFTALVGAGSAKPRLDIVVRNEIAAGRLQGPRMLAATPEITVTGGLADDSRYDYFVPSVSLVCDGAEALRKTVRHLIRDRKRTRLNSSH